MRVYADAAPRGREDGFRCERATGLRSSQDARRLCEEIAFSNARLLQTATAPHGAYARARALSRDGERDLASWLCLLIAYFGPLEDGTPFAWIEAAFEASAPLVSAGALTAEIDLSDPLLGPRGAHEPARGGAALEAYLTLIRRLRGPIEAASLSPAPQDHEGGAAVSRPSSRTVAAGEGGALLGEQAWSPQRRFERAFERLALPGLTRACRFELLTILGVLEIYEMSADSLHLAAAQIDLKARPLARERRSPLAEISREPVLDAAKRVFGIGDAINLERRAKQLAEACEVPLAALDLALYNWGSTARATAGVDGDLRDEQAFDRSVEALGLD